MKQIQKGFTLIELMIVVAIIGILAAVAIPAYQDYVVKAKLSKVVTSLDPIKTALAMYYQENGSFPVETAANVVGTTLTGLTWGSLGLTAVTLPPEVSRLDYSANAAGNNYGLMITFATGKVKAGSIDGQSVMLSPLDGSNGLLNSLAGNTMTINASGVSGGATTLPVFYNCDPTKLDIIAQKFFSNAGVACK